MKAKSSIRRWLLRHLAWLSVLPAAVVAGALAMALIPALYDDIAAENLAFGDAVVAEASQLLDEPAKQLSRIAARIDRAPTLVEAERVLDAATFANSSFDAVYYADEDDRLLLGAIPGDATASASREEMIGLDVSGWAHVREARDRQRVVWSNTHLSAITGKITVAVAVPIGYRVLVGEIGLRQLSEFARRVGSSGHVTVVVVDRRGQVVAHPDPRVGLQQVNLNNLPVVREGRDGERTPQRFVLGGRSYLGTAAPIPGPDWLAIVGQPFDYSQAQINRAILILLVAVVLVGLVAWSLAAKLALRLTAPLAGLVAHAETMSHGNYEATPPEAPWPEFERLHEAMGTMVQAIVVRERALTATEHRYRALVDGMEELIAQFGVRADIQFVNPASEQFLGLLPGACLGMSLFDVLHPDEVAGVRKALGEWIDSEAWQLALETRVLTSAGGARRVLWALSKEYDEAGRLSGFRGIGRDITEVRRGQDALRGLVAATARESGDEFFRSLVRHMARMLDVEHALVAERGIDGTDMHTLAVWSNKSFRENFSYPIAGTPCERLLAAERGILAERISGDCCPLPLCEDNPVRGFLGATLRDSHGNSVGTLIVLSKRELQGNAEFAQLISIFADRAAMELMRQHSEAELRLAASVFQSSAEGIMITDGDHRIISANAACEPITGYAPGELIGETPRILRSGRHGEEFYGDLNAALARDGQWTGEVWNRRKDGHVYPQWMTVTAVSDANGRVVNYISSFFDISARKEAEARIHFLAHHDALTGLPNRVLLQDRIHQAISSARRKNVRVAVLFLDLDRFKLINDSLGHDFGDAMLEQVAARLSRSLREGETVARLGGDEFVIVLPSLTHSEDASVVANRLITDIGRPLDLKGQSFHVTTSVGISVFPDDGDTVETLLRNADTAMYHAKELGRNNFQFYTEALNAIVTERVLLENDMRRGLEQHEFVVHYQPQIDARSGQVIGAEALVRWHHPAKGMISPARFIPVAEDTGMIVPLGEYVLHEACRQAAQWARTLPVPLRMGVNLSARQFAMSNLFEAVQRTLEDTGLVPDRLELELTESMLMERPEDAAALLQRLSALGVRIAIDDFGTGYSSLSYLRRFAIDRLKVDQSFIQDLSSDPNDAAIVRAVISLAHTLNLEVIAEGVETLDHLHRLREWGCFDVQGFLFSKPLPASEFEAFVATAAEGRVLA